MRCFCLFFLSSARRRGLLAAAAALGLVAGCAEVPRPAAPPTEPAAGQPAANRTTTPAQPARWVGRWHGNGPRRLDIRPAGDDRYRLVFRNDQGISRTQTARASGARLYYDGVAGQLALRPGIGAETADPAMESLTQCLIIVPGGGGYCRRADTADALALTEGAYVEVRSDCESAAPADTVFFDGRHLSRPGQSACRSRVISQQGMIFRLADSCAVSAGRSGRANLTASVPDETHLALTPAGGRTTLYRYCAVRSLPTGLAEQAP